MNKITKTPYFEEVIECVNGIITASNIRLATQEEIEKAESLHKEGKCPHNIVYDVYGWMYDFRMCYTCGGSLGTV